MNLQHDQGSHLFLVRFWAGGAEEAKDKQEAARDERAYRVCSGRVQHILSGEARTFHDWTTLIELLLEMSETEEAQVNAQGRGAEARIEEAAR